MGRLLASRYYSWFCFSGAFLGLTTLIQGLFSRLSKSKLDVQKIVVWWNMSSRYQRYVEKRVEGIFDVGCTKGFLHQLLAACDMPSVWSQRLQRPCFELPEANQCGALTPGGCWDADKLQERHALGSRFCIL